MKERFEQFFIPEPNSGCWLWEGRVDGKGYGRFSCGNVKLQRAMERAHRASYQLYRGPIQVGMCVCHRCDNPACVNPDHLFLGTNADNVADRERKGRNINHRGERHGCAKLTEQQVKEIRRLYDLGMPQHELARRFSTPRPTICFIVMNKIWTHLPHATRRGRPPRMPEGARLLANRRGYSVVED